MLPPMSNCPTFVSPIVRNAFSSHVRRSHSPVQPRYIYSTAPSQRVTPTCSVIVHPDVEAAPSSQVRSRPVPGLSDWRYAGPPLSEGPLPAVVYFALTAEQSLELDPFNQFVANMVTLPNPSVRVFSVTLPFHTEDLVASEAVFHTWASVYDAGGDVVSAFTRKTCAALDHLLHTGYISGSKLFIAGLSRGAMLAAHVAAARDDIGACLGFAPLTVLSDLPEFAHLDAPRALDKMQQASLLGDHIANGLVHVPVRLYMGNFDQRVGTRNAFEMAHRLAEMAAANGIRSPPHEFIMYCR